jgi:microcystin-dependent protein
MDPFIGQISIFSFGLIPKGWMTCDGTMLQISQYAALYSLIGTYYGGNGTTIFALPDLRGRVPVCNIYGESPGTKMGVETVTLSASTTPMHNHQITAVSTSGDSPLPNGHFIANTGSLQAPLYAGGGTTPKVALNMDTIGVTGGDVGHTNIQPSLVLNFCIAVEGIYPQRP